MPKSELVKFEGDTLTFNDAKITSVTLSENGGTINVTGHQDIYGLIYLTYNLKQPKHCDSGRIHRKGVRLWREW